MDQRAYAEVGTPVAARVTRLLVNAGDAVRSGQTLVELTSPELARERAEYLSASARLTLAEAALERKRGLAAEKIVPLREVQEAESAAGEARAALRASRAAIAAFGVEPPTDDGDGATSSVVRAAVARWRARSSSAPRSSVRCSIPAAPAFRIGNLSTLWLTVHAFERDAVRIQQGVTARLSFPALPGQDFAGTVTMVGRHVERESRTVPVRIDVKNRGNLSSPRHVCDRDAAGRRDRRSHPDRPRRLRSTRSQRVVRVPAQRREPLRDSPHRPRPRSRRRSGSALRASRRRERSSSMARSCSRLRPKRAKATTMTTEARHD